MRILALAIACLSSCQAQTEVVARNSPLIVPAQASAIVQSAEPVEAGPAASVQAPAPALPAESVFSLAFSADGKRLRAVGSSGESMVVFVQEVSSGTRLSDYRLPPNADYLGGSENLSYLAYRLAQGPVTVVDTEQKSEQALGWLRLPSETPLHVVLTDDGSLMSVGHPGDMSAPLEVYDLKKKARVFSRKLGVAAGGHNLIAVFPDGKYVRTGHNREGWFVEKMSGGAKSLRLSILTQWSSDGRWALEVPGMLTVEPLDCGPGEIPLKDGHTGRRVGGLDRKYAEEERESARAVFCGSSAVVFASFQTISIHRVPQGTELQRWTTTQLTGGEEDPRSLACSPSGDRIALGAPRLQVIPVQPQPQ